MHQHHLIAYLKEVENTKIRLYKSTSALRSLFTSMLMYCQAIFYSRGYRRFPNEDHLKQAAKRLDTHLKEIEETRQTESTGTNPVTISDAKAKG